ARGLFALPESAVARLPHRKDGSMNRRFLFTTGTIGTIALFVAGTTVDVQAQRGAGIGHASAPTHVGQGRPATAGRPDTAGRPAGATGKPTTTSGKPDSAGRPAIADRLSRRHWLATPHR